MTHDSKTSDDISDLFWLTDAQMARLELFFPKPRGKPRIDHTSVLSGIIDIKRMAYGGATPLQPMAHTRR